MENGEVTEQGFAEWQDWRHHLDYRKAWAFLALSCKRSQAFVEDVWAWDAFYHQLVCLSIFKFSLRRNLLPEDLRSCRPGCAFDSTQLVARPVPSASNEELCLVS